MSIKKESKPVCSDGDDEEDLEMLRLMALQSRKNKATSNPATTNQQQNLDNDSEDSDSSVDSLDRLIQDMDYELLDTPKEERVYSKKRNKSKKKEKQVPIKECNSTASVSPPSIKECSDSVEPKDEEAEIVNTVSNIIEEDNKIEAIGSRIPTLTEALPVDVRNSNNPSHISRAAPEVTCKSVPFRSRSRSWSRESSPYRRTRFSRSPERRTPSRSIFPDLTNVQLSPRALAFVYNNTGILIKRRDRRSSSSSNDYFSSDSSSRRSISPYACRSYKPSSPQPSYSGQIPSRRSRSSSRPKSRQVVNKQRPYKSHPKVPRRQQIRDGTKKNAYKKETSRNRRRQKSCSISLSPSPEPMIKQPINFGRNNYISCNARNRIQKYDHKNFKSSANDKKYNGDLGKITNKELNTNRLANSNKVVNINKTLNINKTVDTDKILISNKTCNTLDEQVQDKTSKCANVKAVPCDRSSAGVAEEAKTETAANEPMEDGIELTIDTSIDDVWSSESSGDEREGRFKTSTKETKQAASTKISFSARTSAKPLCVSLDEIINKDRSGRNTDDSKKNSLRFNRNNRDSWSKSNKNRGIRSSRVRYESNNRRSNNIHSKISSVSSSTKPLPKKESSDLKDKPLQKEIISTDSPDIKKPELSSKIISLRPKPNPVVKDTPERKPIVIDDKNTDILKVNKTQETKTDDNLKGCVHMRRVKAFDPANCPSSSRLVQSALIGAVASQPGAAKRLSDSRQARKADDNTVSSVKKPRSSEIRRVRWIKPEEKQDEGEDKTDSGRLPVRLRLGDGSRSSSSSRRRRNRAFADKQYAEDVHQV